MGGDDDALRVGEASLLQPLAQRGLHREAAPPQIDWLIRLGQRAAIARTLAMQPRVILFDEPTSALDPEMVQEVLNVIRTLADEGRTMLLVTHELGFARQVSSQVVFLHQGQVEEIGTPDQVFDNPGSERCRQFMSSHK